MAAASPAKLTPSAGIAASGAQSPSKPAAAASSPVAKSPSSAGKVPTGPQVTRLQMLEYLNGREWWGYGRRALSFTFFLWLWFIILMYLRADVEALFRVREAVVEHVERVLAHPSLSGAPLYLPAETPLKCRCACRSRGRGEPSTPCDATNGELVDFIGRVPAQTAAELLESHQGSLGGGLAVPPRAWEDVSSTEDAWFWVEHGLLPDVWGRRGGQQTVRPGLLQHRNLVVGGLRARQRRGQLATPCKVAPGALGLYTARCRSSQEPAVPFGPAAGSASPSDLQPAARAFAPAGTAGSGGAEDEAYDAMFDVELPLAGALETAAFLRRQGWLDQATESLELEALLLNAEAGAYAILHIAFRFPFHGGVEKEIRVHVFHALQNTSFAVMDFIPEIVWLVFIFWLFIQALGEIVLSICQRRAMEYFTNFWSLVDWISVILGVGICFFFYMMLGESSRIAEGISGLPHSPLASDLNINSYHEAWASVLEKAKYVFELKKYYLLCLFWYTTVITLRFLKGCMGQAKLAMIQSSLTHSFMDLLHCMILFTVLFANFVLGGRVLFGDELEAWSTYSQAAGSSLRMLMGSSLFDDMYAVAPVSATMWFWLFIMTMVFIVMNLLLAIIIDKYLGFRKAIGNTVSLFHDIHYAISEFAWRMDWRKENFMDGEYKACFWDNPYTDLQEGLVEASKIDEEAEAQARANCLGLVISRKKLEDMSMGGLAADGHPGADNTSSLELRKLGCDAMTAEHLLDLCNEHNEQNIQGRTKLKEVQQFVKLLQSHYEELDQHCEAIEAGALEEQETLRESLDRLEASVFEAVEGFQGLREVGVATLAPPPPGQTGQMKSAGAFEHSGNNFLYLANATVSNASLVKRC